MSATCFMRVILATLLVTFASPIALHAQGVGKVVVEDGDTIKLSIRLVGCDTPEIGPRAKCDWERKLGTQAKARLKALLANGHAAIELVECSCPPGTLGTEECNYGRACGRLFVDRKDVCETLISEKLARPYDFKWNAPPPKATWCSTKP